MKKREWFTRVVRLLQKEDGYTFGLNFAYLMVTFTALVLPILVWFAVGVVAHQALRDAAESASYAGQSQVHQAETTTKRCYFSTTLAIDPNKMQAEAQDLWQQEIQNKHLTNVFANLQMDASLQGVNVVVVATGEYMPSILQGIAQKYPSLFTLVSVPMHVTVQHEYYIPSNN